MIKYFGQNATTKILQLIKGELTKKEVADHKVTSISADSTDEQYPSAKAVYTALDGAMRCEFVNTTLVIYSGAAVSGTKLIIG